MYVKPNKFEFLEYLRSRIDNGIIEIRYSKDNPEESIINYNY